MRDLSRQSGISPGQISKQIKSLELKLGVQLLDRSSQGVKATAEAAKLMPYFEQINELHLKLLGQLNNDTREDFLSFASTSFLTTNLLPDILSSYEKQVPQTRFRMIDLPPSQFISSALRGGFQLCVHIGDLDWPKTWSSIKVGDIVWELYCRKDHPLSARAKLPQILSYPFVYPVYWSNEGLRFGDDNCPVGINKRQQGHETATATSAVELVRRTDNLGFLPSLVCRSYLERGELRKINVKSWKPVVEPLYLTVKNDFIKQKTFLAFKKLLEQEVK